MHRERECEHMTPNVRGVSMAWRREKECWFFATIVFVDSTLPPQSTTTAGCCILARLRSFYFSLRASAATLYLNDGMFNDLDFGRSVHRSGCDNT